MNIPILELKGISYQYPDHTAALKNVSLKIERGKKIALLGNNGAGKSTLLLHLNAILTPSAGHMLFKGERMTYKRIEKQKLRQHVGIVFQDPDSQLFSSSVYEDIKYGPRNMGLAPEKVKEAVDVAMALTETASLKEKPPHFLSLGQKKRVAIAGVLAMNPELLILDEPTAGLDPYYTKKIMNVLNAIQNENRTMIISTHDVNLAFEWADEVWIMNDGKIISTGCPTIVFQDEAILNKSHLEKPWIMDVFETIKGPMKNISYPRSRIELLRSIQEAKAKQPIIKV
ncbi:energy-coupling factor ABC transporter ATP-binding protein [Pueribacillus theae]|uniref:ABC transporter ATP-binding protein n=1 Tax=Pueribacillus theae TaxID=2171751 RepID=A0A2U1K4X0_9BACI|nr:ABC transporter ATP-binding protein [Pueribacillus theae]PWA12209.1 energy-coupling factor ABC transporter ATP-binding protein [Pueribacillus theae]